MEPCYVNSPVTSQHDHDEFLNKLAKDYGVEIKKKWVNNNFTNVQNTYVILKSDKADIISKIYKYNMASGRPPVLWIPDSLWGAEKETIVLNGNESWDTGKEVISIKGNTVETLVAKESNKIKVFEKDGKYYLRITGGISIEDAETELFEKYGLAFFPYNIHGKATS